MSIASSFPTIKPSLLLDFANVRALDPRITFTRSTTATYYDGVTTAKAEENLLLQSQDITTTWTNANSTDTGNTSVAPDGTTTADTLTDNNTSGAHVVRQAIVNSINTTYVISCFLKAGTSNYAYLGFYDPAIAQRYFVADFDLSAGTVRTSAAGTSGTLTSSSITSVGNGWYRCVVIGQVSAGTSQAVVVGVSDGSTAFTNFGTIVYVGSGSTIEVWGAQLEQRDSVTAYTATTTQPITNYIPVLQTAAANVARFDHTPTTGEALGLLVEEQRTNLLTYSEQFDNAAWSKTNTSSSANTIVAPDGTLTGDTIVMDAISNNDFYLYQVYSGWTSGVTYTQSWYVKSAGISWVQVTGSTGTAATNFRNINITTGELGNGNYSSGSVTVTSVGNGWYRISVTEVATSTSASGRFLLALLTSDVATRLSNVDGNGYSGIFIWGAQLEVGAFPTSYTATTSAQVTRSADAASMTGANFSSWYRQDEGTLYAESQLAIQSTTTRTVARISDGTSNNFIDIRYRTTGISGEVITQNSVTQVNLSASVSAITANQSLKDAFAFDFNNAAASANNQSASTDTSCVIPLVNEIDFGAVNATNYLNGHIRKLAFYPQRLTNAQLQALTS